MMWIYGGSLTAGSNQFNEYGSIRWMDQDVILVVPNYRLGPFGFTSLGIDDAPGNQGFLDLVQALRWINTNIEFFGGDPGRVTIFGESSGSWAVSYLAISPLANGLFQRGIMQSGGLFNPFWTWRTQEDAIQLGGFLAENLGCSKDGNTDQMLECLQEVSVDALEDSINWGTEETYGIQKILRPTGIIDGKFLPANPVNLMERGEYNHVDLMVGVTKDEGLLQMYQLELNPELYVVASIFWNSIFGPMFLFGRFGNYDITEEDKEMTNLITKYYLGEPGAANINQQHFQNMTDMISDAYIWYGSHKQAEWAAAHGDNVYKYMFTFKGTYGFADAFGLDNSKYGVCHADELYYFWKPYWKKAAIQMTPAEELVAERMLNSWANFAKYGDPSIPGSDINWSPLTAENQEYMNIGEEWKMEISEDYVNRMRAWDEIYKYPTGNTLPTIPLGEQTGDRILN
ncbi:acetylcholinesterase 1 isoform X2 [Eurytemora carolleeae]|nr:acetylcholinesterase 1 isoform X2 [Eurytemora carolleeae]|eukprot:XP_023332473.1 acetylcholinesterase 1-like isoform X2 [Eurytemora affinis]